MTAYDRHAIRAFEFNALDYLLRPFSDERMEATLARARARLSEVQAGEFRESVLRMLSEAPRRGRYGEFALFLRHGGQTRVSRTYRALLEQRLGQAL